MSRAPIEPAYYGYIRIASLLLASLSAAAMATAISLYACKTCLAEFVAAHLSEIQKPAHQLAEATQARLLAIPLKLLGVGIVLAMTSMVTRYAGARAVAVPAAPPPWPAATPTATAATAVQAIAAIERRLRKRAEAMRVTGAPERCRS